MGAKIWEGEDPTAAGQRFHLTPPGDTTVPLGRIVLLGMFCLQIRPYDCIWALNSGGLCPAAHVSSTAAATLTPST